MKCPHCKGDFTPPEGRSIANCPFCGEPLLKPTVSKKCENLAEALAFIAENYGADILLHDQRLVAFLRDYLPKGNLERNILRQAFGLDIPAKFHAAVGKTPQEQQIVMARCVKQIADNYGAAENIVAAHLWVFAEVLGWEKRSEQKPEPAPVPEKSAPKPTAEQSKPAPKPETRQPQPVPPPKPEARQAMQTAPEPVREAPKPASPPKPPKMESPLDKVLAPLRACIETRAERQAALQARREIDEANLNAENEKAKAATEEKRAWISQGLCQHCGGKMGLFKVCKVCGKKKSESEYPRFTPRTPDESLYMLKDKVTLNGIDWLILEIRDGKALLLAEKILEIRKYHAAHQKITWESCSLRKYLNGEFFDKLGVLKAAVAQTRNANPDNPWLGTSGGNDTADKIFLLSLDEVVKYFGDSGDLAHKRRKNYDGTDMRDGNFLFDQYCAARAAKDVYGEMCEWWLRSPGSSLYNAVCVESRGNIAVCGSAAYIESHAGENRGMRPALWLNL